MESKLFASRPAVVQGRRFRGFRVKGFVGLKAGMRGLLELSELEGFGTGLGIVKRLTV